MSIGVRFLWFVIGMALFTWPLRADAQTFEDLVGQTVVSVSFEVDGRPESSPAVMALSNVRVGQPLRQQDVRATLAQLDALGRYEDIAIFGSMAPGGVAVTFRLTPRRQVSRVDVRGETGVAAGAIQNVLRQRYGGVPTGVRLSAVESTALQFLSEEGYLDASVVARTEFLPGAEGATLVLDIRAGQVATIGTTEVRGVSPLSPAEVVRRTATGAGQPFRRRQIESALTAIEDDLRGRGYYEAQATLQMARTPTGVDLTITITTGPLVTVQVAPRGALPGSVDDLIPIRRLGSADLDLLEDSRARIERALRAQGYWRAQAPFTRVLDENGQHLVIAFNVMRGPRFYVDRVEWPSNMALPETTVRELVGVRPGDLFDEDRFVAGLAQIVNEYRRQGYYRVAAAPSYEQLAAGSTDTRAAVVLHPNIEEGPRGVVTNIRFTRDGAAAMAESDLRAVMRTTTGQPYVELDAARDRTAIENLYLDQGFRTAQVSIQPEFSGDGREVALDVRIVEGRQVHIGRISVVGNERVSERAIREEMRLELGAPAGVARITDAQSRLVDMGVFRRVTITAADQFTEPETHLIVNVVEAPATTVGYGGGIEGGRYTRSREGGTGGSEERIEFAPRGFFEISRRNLGGRNRALSFFSRVSLKRDPTPPDPGVETGGFGFTEYRVTGTYRERHAFRSDTDLLFGITSEQAERTTFNFIRQSINAEMLRVLRPQLSLSGRYALEFTRLFDIRFGEADQPVIDRAFPQVRLSMLSTGVAWDRRDNLLNPTRGTLVTADFQVAARSIGSEVGFVKTFFQGSAFHAVDAAARTIVAGRAQFGVARGFPRTAVVLDENGNPFEAEVEDLPASQRFFAGGGTTVRGFQLDRLGVLNADGLPLGGNGLVVLNAELRRTLTTMFGRGVGVVGFVDAGNVFRRATDLNVARVRGSAGFGVRYDSPLGPLRLDFGFKMRRATDGNRRERGWEYHLSIGEAF